MFESHHSGSYIRLFPDDDENRMNELMNILTKCFQVLYVNKDDLSWNMKYYKRYNQEELLHKIAQLENINQTNQLVSSRLTYASFD
jgi:hypothetical protein